MKKYYQFMRQITYIGFFLLVVFAVQSFHEAIPDQIYVTKGQTVSYDFGVPVSVELKEDDASEVFENLFRTPVLKDASEDGISGSYMVTCRLLAYFRSKMSK